MQTSILIPTTPPLPGAALVDDVNDALATIATNFAGDTDPAALAPPYATWADTANGLLKRRNAAGTAWITLRKLWEYTPSTSDIAYYAQPIGLPHPLWDHLAGVSAPPTDNPGFRYIRLTASDSYNAGVLTGETVTGSAPNITATAVINDPSSPMNGQTVHLINTERNFLRAGSSGTLQSSQNASHSHGTANGTGFVISGNAGTTAAASGTGGTVWGSALNTGSAGGDEARPRSIGGTFYLRIR
ncbi:hypothetical protein [Achromobacter xylosoxidans]|uniref:Uncharacterized protein n=1 Tax=Alcaligenes xylosoxydans xylosoxydans TaxID=85698 RepID=A0A0X8NXP5_ALCXX|nr:hypothetical protein [Achromobacter xylosoxidans]AMG36242.1 hypothetical protein AL504_09490 [Achromobacter xylosoxidans]